MSLSRSVLQNTKAGNDADKTADAIKAQGLTQLTDFPCSERASIAPSSSGNTQVMASPPKLPAVTEEPEAAADTNSPPGSPTSLTPPRTRLSKRRPVAIHPTINTPRSLAKILCSDSDDDLSVKAKDSIEDLTSTVPRSPRSSNASLSPRSPRSRKETKENIVPPSPTRSPRSPRQRLQKRQPSKHDASCTSHHAMSVGIGAGENPRQAEPGEMSIVNARLKPSTRVQSSDSVGTDCSTLDDAHNETARITKEKHSGKLLMGLFGLR
jgi:hypothetical protein